MDDERLGAAIASAAVELEWPAAPDFSASVTEAIRDRERHPSLRAPRLSLRSRRRTIAIVVAILLLLAATAVAAKLVIDLGAVSVKVLPGKPTALPTAVASGPTLGHVATLEEAEAQTGFSAVVPAVLGSPDRVWVDVTDAGSRIVLAWRATNGLPSVDGLPWGAILYEFKGQFQQDAKLLFSEGDTFQTAHVSGRRAFWITGPHELDLLTGEGTFARFRVTGNVLVWRGGGLTLRLETELSKTRSIEIAQGGNG